MERVKEKICTLARIKDTLDRTNHGMLEKYGLTGGFISTLLSPTAQSIRRSVPFHHILQSFRHSHFATVISSHLSTQHCIELT